MTRRFILSMLLLMPTLAPAQYFSVGVGGLFSQGRSAALANPLAGNVLGTASADFSKTGILTLDAGTSVLPFMTAGVHYSFSRPELTLRRGDAFGSSAVADLNAHTLTFDARLRAPRVVGLRPYGLAGVGFTRFNMSVRNQVEVAFPGGAGSVTSPVFTFGAGVERKLLPLVGAKLEVRDYLSPLSEKFYQPGGSWNRVAVIVGLVLGR